MDDDSSSILRLFDPQHLRELLIDTSTFLIAHSTLLDYLVRQPHGFLSLAPPDEGRDRRIAEGDPDTPSPELIADCIDFFVDMGALDDGARQTLAALDRRREQVASRTHTLLGTDASGELLAATLEARDLLRRLARWWIIEIECAVDPALLEGKAPEEVEVAGGPELVIDLLLNVAHQAASPDEAG